MNPLPIGEVLGLVKVVGCLKITPELIAKISSNEKAIGNWKLGHFAWQLKVVLFDVRATGRQGVWWWTI